MKLAINLDTLTFVAPGNPSVTARDASMRRDDILPLDIVFFEGTASPTRVELSDSAVVSVQVNLKDEFGGSGLASESGATKAGTGMDATYSFTLALTDSGIGAAFDAADNPASIGAILEVKITDGTFTQRTEPLSIRLQNSVHQS